ncbi:putative Glutathione-regulated potassium-efflux system protein KefB [Candidatus Rhodobacter oscarellae]|uniref:Putative Glutathione-regulated potassium-efflux system protein KefB n=1 Tax=Candidatus Rhodobacter oscarellae TaxID=1675527 RepID=A0A0J9E160_9RHOB|nr:cation:proton antiporter [Candidatus Rhodobacter lobularis]KMW56475.1 putative Glutathione-regulated potassium-efflux system protein KefB [Candidatus Rhodobacter lobularis]
MDFLSLAFIFLIAGVVAVPIASKFGLGSVLGYLIAGIAIAPVLNAAGVDVISLQHFAEFGVVMMLFLVGLELEPKLLWQMRNKLLGLGGLQVCGTAVIVMGVAMLFGLEWTISLAIGLIFALSSTAIVLQTLNEKGLMKSDGGQSSFSVLLFQDIAVIPMLALIPLLAMPDLMEQYAAPAPVEIHAEEGHGTEEAAHQDAHGGGHDAHDDGHHGPSGPTWIETLPGGLRALVTIAAIAAVIVGGSFLTRPIFRFIALAKLRELFTATALMMVIGIALLMSLVGLSPALGTFLAGVVLANSEYRHELESDIDPFKGLLLGLFFMTVGAGIDFQLLFGNFAVILALTLGLIALKAGVLLALSFVFKIEGADRWLFALGLAQAGEFGFVLLSFTTANNVVPPVIADQLLLIVALSMLLTPALFIAYERLILPRYTGAEEREADVVDDEAPIIIAGVGRFGGVVNRMLLGAGYKTVVLDHSSEQLDAMRAFDVKAFYGDASRPDLLHAAGLHEAKLLVVAIDDREQANAIVHHVSQNHPHVHIIARAVDRHQVYELYAAGCRNIIRDTFDSAVRAGRSAYEALGVHPFQAQRMARGFEDHDRYMLRDLAQLYRSDIPQTENPEYIQRAMELRDEMDEALRNGTSAFHARVDRGWSPPGTKDVDAEEAQAKES